MNTLWKTIPLFISSTFRDMHAERDQLNRVVFPAIEERLKPRRCRLEPIDLRIGVETDSTQTERERELKILKVCLAEIERSRPFLLVLLGDRYGWVPGSDRIDAAASEAGFTPEDNHASVTALEIEYGLLKKDPLQRRRSLLCLREPLPYNRMPADKAAVFSDTHATDPGAPDRVSRLQKLKEKIFADSELSCHRLPYKLDWNEASRQPHADGANGIKAWRQKVEAALWQLLDDETKAFAAQKEPTWQEEELFTIEEFVERLNRSFVGREQLIRQTVEFALAPMFAESNWGICFTGDSGAGKSALFARFHQLFTERTGQSGDQAVLLLAHAAGASPRAGQTEWMLRRWIGEIRTALGDTSDIPQDVKSAELEKLFAQLLNRVAATRRVVILVDALNQFARTERARMVSWLPSDWPTNARFIATTIPGEESAQLAGRRGFRLVDLGPLAAVEGDAIAVQVYGRYHRQPNRDVLREVFAIRHPDGAPAAGNPLWLTLALDLLNQLDADDFSAAEARQAGSRGEKLQRVVLDRARALPPDVAELYGVLLERVEKVAGAPEARAFAALISISRHGWREEDLEQLLPAGAQLFACERADRLGSASHPFAWDPLRFAVLRRCFRAHLVQRGSSNEWDFAHATLRQAIVARLGTEWAKGGATVTALHACCADHLENLPAKDVMRDSELMFHLLALRDPDRAAACLSAATGSIRNFKLSIENAVAVLVEAIRSARNDQDRAGLVEWIAGLLRVSNQEHALGVAEAIVNQLDGALANIAARETDAVRDRLLEAVRVALQPYAVARQNRPEGETTMFHVPATGAPIGAGGFGYTVVDEGVVIDYAVSLLATCIRKIGAQKVQCGNSQAAMADYEESKVLDRLSDTRNPGCMPAVSSEINSQSSMADALMEQGQLAAALKLFREICDRVKPYAVFPDLRMHLLHLECRIAEVLHRMGDLAGALTTYRQSLENQAKMLTHALSRVENTSFNLDLGPELKTNPQEFRAALAKALTSEKTKDLAVASDPTPVVWRHMIAQTRRNIGEVLVDTGDVDGALTEFRKSLDDYTRVNEADPMNTNAQYNAAGCQSRIGYLLRQQGDTPNALTAYRDAHARMAQLLAISPSNERWQAALGTGLINIGALLYYQGEAAEARSAFEGALRVSSKLVEQDPANGEWQNDLWIAYSRMGTITEALCLDEASTWWRKAFEQLCYLKDRGLMKPSDEQFLAPLRERAQQAVGSQAAPTLRDVGIAELRESADRCLQKQLWETAATYLEKLLQQGEPVEAVAPDLITALLNAHETVALSTITRIETLLAQLESAGHAKLAVELRRQHAAKLTPPKKPRWKFW